MKQYKIEVSYLSGGEFAMGIITDEEKMSILREKVEEGGFNLYDLEEEGIPFYENDDVLHCFGGDATDGKISIFENDKEILDTEISEINRYQSSNPWVNFEKLQEEIGEFLVFGGAVYEKRMYGEFSFQLEDDEKFDTNKLVILVINLDETFGDWEIIDEIIYFREKELKTIWDKVYKECELDGEYDDEEKIETIMEFYEDESLSEEIVKMIKNLAIESGDMEGINYGSEAILIYDKDRTELFEQWN